jgi:predicted dinucleotide-binding enzyme
MKIAILGTGMVGQTVGGKLAALGHDVKMGSRTTGNEKAAEFVKKNGAKASAGTFADAAAFGDIVFNCTNGAGALEALQAAGAANLKGKVIVDISNPLDFSKGMPPSLSVCNDDSLGERIQKAFPEAHVVKTLNTVNCDLMVNPAALAGGDHTMFLCGNDAGAKGKVREISQARGTEMYLPLWVRMYGKLQTPSFSIKVVR